MSLVEDLRRLATQADAIPAKLEGVRTALVGLRAQLADAQNAVKDREAEELSLVSAEQKDTKPVYSNAAAREAEVKRRLATNKAYQGMLTLEQDAQHVKALADVELLRLEDEERALDRQFTAVGLVLRAEIAHGLESAIREFTVLEAARFAKTGEGA